MIEQDTKDIPFDEVLDALLDDLTILNPRYLYRLSDLEGVDLDRLKSIWPQINIRRRQALLEDLEALLEMDYVLSFESLSRLALSDPEPKVRAPATRILWESESPDLLATFFDSCKDDPDPEVRAHMASALGRFVYLGELEELPSPKQKEVEDRLLDIISSEDEIQVRRRALESMGYSSREEVPGLLLEAYHKGDEAWLASALYAMGRSADPEWSDNILEQFEHFSPQVRYEAARAAGELEIHQAVHGLLELLSDVNYDVKTASIWSLSQIGGEGVFETLEALMLATEDDDLADFIDEALDNLVFTEDRSIFRMLNIDEGKYAPMILEENGEAGDD